MRHHPGAATTGEVSALTRTVVIYRRDIRTERFTWHDRDSAGFVGLVEFGIPCATGETLRQLFSTLRRFAALAGLGHGTTHGLGATDIQPTNRSAWGRSHPSADGHQPGQKHPLQSNNSCSASYLPRTI